MRSERILVHGSQKNWLIILELLTVSLLFVFAASYQLLTLGWIGMLLVLTVFLFGIRYGIGYGLLTLGMALGVYVFYAVQSGSDPVVLLYEPDFIRFSISAFFIGLLSGMFRTSLNERYQDLFYEKDELQTEFEQARQTLDAFRQANGQMKKKIVESRNNLANIYAITNLLNRGHSEKILNEAMRIIKDQYGADVFGIYHVDHSAKVWRLKVHRSLQDDRMPASYFFEDHPQLFKTILREKELYMRKLDSADRSGPIICAPIYTGQDVKYVLVIRKVDLFRLTMDGLETLKWILRFVSDPLADALQKEELRRQESLVPGTSFYSLTYYEEMLAILEERKQRFNHPFSSFTVPLPKKPLSLDRVHSSLRRELREMDIISWNPDSYDLQFLLPGTEREFVDAVKSRVFRALNEEVV